MHWRRARGVADGADGKREALKAGANGFLLKDLPPEQLAAAVLTVSYSSGLVRPAADAAGRDQAGQR